MKKGNILILIIILIVAVVSLGAGFVIAETTSVEKIYAAYSLKNGAMRYLPDPNNYNQKLEVPISWDKESIQGAPGPQGPAGIDGSTPHIGNNGNWWIGEIDTGVIAGFVTKYYTVTFNPNGGSMPDGYPLSITLPSGSYIENLPIPTPTGGSAFIGWQLAPYYPLVNEADKLKNSLQGQFTSLTPVFKDMTLVAVY